MRRLPQRIAASFMLTSALVFLSNAVHAADGKPAPQLQLMDVFQLEHASDPQISPDGKQVVYVRNFMDVMHDRRRSDLWIVDADGSDHRPLTNDHKSSQPRWSPDGGRIAYVSKDVDDGPAQIFCRWMDGGQTARLTQLDAAPDHLQWSRDGRWIAFVKLVLSPAKPFVDMPAKPDGAKWAEPPRVIGKVLYRFDGSGYLKDGFRHVFVLPADGGTPKQVTTGAFHHHGPLSWAIDDEAIYFSANRNDDWEYDPRESEIFAVAVDATDGSITRVTNRKGPDQSPAVSPKGRYVAWLGFDDRKLSYQVTNLYVMQSDGGERRSLTTKLDRSVKSPVWSTDGSGLYFQFDDTGTTKVGFVTLDGEISTLANQVGGVTIGRPYASGSFSANGHGLFAYTHSTPDHPADVVVAKRGSKQTKTVTHLNDDLFEQRQLATVEEFWFKSSLDERKIQSWIVKPPNFDPAKKHPLILEIHGGPFANYGDRFSSELQYYAAAGYVVLYVNPRGSTSYGQEFANLIHHNYPGPDYDDLMSGVDAVIGKGYVDAERLFVTGGSGGGILTAWIVGKTNRFQAAVAAKPVINWYSFVLTTDVYPYFNGYWFPGPPWKHTEQYLRRSPISLIENVTTPTMLLTGEVDHRTPISESEQFYQALKIRKVDTMLVRVPDASHGIVRRPSRLIMKVQHILKWFERYGGSD